MCIAVRSGRSLRNRQLRAGSLPRDGWPRGAANLCATEDSRVRREQRANPVLCPSYPPLLAAPSSRDCPLPLAAETAWERCGRRRLGMQCRRGACHRNLRMGGEFFRYIRRDKALRARIRVRSRRHGSQRRIGLRHSQALSAAIGSRLTRDTSMEGLSSGHFNMFPIRGGSLRTQAATSGARHNLLLASGGQRSPVLRPD